MRFADIPGHDDVKRRLVALADQDRIPHALLLEGPQGAAKMALARAFAQYVHCQNRHDGDSCGSCPACKQHASFNHIDTIFSFPIVRRSTQSMATSDDWITEFRDLLTEDPYMDFENWLNHLDNINAQPLIYVDEANELLRKLSFTAHTSKYKVVIMWLPERLKEDAANKLLKLVEEPYADTLFVMASDNSRLILPTIYSRTQRIAVKRYSDAEVAAYLERDWGLDPSDASNIARMAAGSLSEAAKLISVSKERKLYLEYFINLMRKAYGRDVRELKEWALAVSDLGRERIMQFLDYVARMMRENFILNLKVGELNCLNSDELQFSSRFSPFINERNVLKLFDFVNEAKIDIAANSNPKIVLFDLAIKVILLLKA